MRKMIATLTLVLMISGGSLLAEQGSMKGGSPEGKGMMQEMQMMPMMKNMQSMMMKMMNQCMQMMKGMQMGEEKATSAPETQE